MKIKVFIKDNINKLPVRISNFVDAETISARSSMKSKFSVPSIIVGALARLNKIKFKSSCKASSKLGRYKKMSSLSNLTMGDLKNMTMKDLFYEEI